MNRVQQGNRRPPVRLALCMALGLALAGPARAASPPERPSDRVRAWQTGLLRPDRLQHASLAMTGGLTLGVLTRKPGPALGGALTLGLLKELWDARRGGFDPVDLLASGLGGAVAAGATAALHR